MAKKKWFVERAAETGARVVKGVFFDAPKAAFKKGKGR